MACVVALSRASGSIPATAPTLAVPFSLRDTVSPTVEDWYKFSATAGQVVTAPSFKIIGR